MAVLGAWLACAPAPAAGRSSPARPAPSPGTFHVLELEGAVDSSPLRVYLEHDREGFTRGFAIAPRFNRTSHTVDASGLLLSGDRLSGKLSVTIHPDPYVPEDGRPVPATYTIEAAATGDRITGTFRGRYGSRSLRGKMTGSLLAPPVDPEGVLIELDLENTFRPGGSRGAWVQRARLELAVESGRVTAGRMRQVQTSPSHALWSATVDASGIRLAGGRVAAWPAPPGSMSAAARTRSPPAP